MERGRLKSDLLVRTEAFCDRCLAVAEQLLADGRFPRICDQLAAAGTSVGANLAEAHEAMSLKDFRKCLSISVKELAETRFWIRLCVRRGWFTQAKVQDLLQELEEIKRILGSILHRTRPSTDCGTLPRRVQIETETPAQELPTNGLPI